MVHARHRILRIVLAAAAAACAATSPALADPRPGDTLVAAIRAADQQTQADWAYTRRLRVKAHDEEQTEVVSRIDPSQPPGKRCIVLSGKDADACEDALEIPTYSKLQRLLSGARIERLSENSERAVYRAHARRAPGLKIFGIGIRFGDDDKQPLLVMLDVAKSGAHAPFVEHVKIELEEAEGNTLARVQQLTIRYDYQPDQATGALLLRGYHVDVGVSILKSFSVSTRVESQFEAYQRVAVATVP